MITKDKIDTNRNGVHSVPSKKYHAIKTTKGEVFYNAIRTRNNWNDLRGNLLTFNQYVTDIQKEYVCPKCKREELLWDSAFNADNEYLISCDYCRDLTFLVAKDGSNNPVEIDQIFISQLTNLDNIFTYWVGDTYIDIYFTDVLFYHYTIKYHRQNGITELYLEGKKVHSIPNMPEETSILNLVYLVINDWLRSEQETINSYFENKID